METARRGTCRPEGRGDIHDRERGHQTRRSAITTHKAMMNMKPETPTLGENLGIDVEHNLAVTAAAAVLREKIERFVHVESMKL